MATDTAHTFPPTLASAIVAVKCQLGKLGKSHDNKHGGYKFASIDDFMMFVGPAMNDAGLFIIPGEDGDPELVTVTTSTGKPAAMWRVKHAFTIAHTSGQSFGPVNKTVMVQAVGAQSAGASQSYALKQLYRGLFNIATGDGDDPDREKVSIAGRGEEETSLQRRAGKIRRALLTAGDLNELSLVWSDNSIDLDQIKATSDVAFTHLSSEYARRKAELGGR